MTRRNKKGRKEMLSSIGFHLERLQLTTAQDKVLAHALSSKKVQAFSGILAPNFQPRRLKAGEKAVY